MKFLKFRGRGTKFVDIIESDIRFICDTVYDDFFSGPTLLQIDGPLFICGN